MTYTVLSPDGFPLTCDAKYLSLAAARRALAKWCKRYEHQGYYRDNNWNQIEIAELPDHCRIVDLDDTFACIECGRLGMA